LMVFDLPRNSNPQFGRIFQWGDCDEFRRRQTSTMAPQSAVIPAVRMRFRTISGPMSSYCGMISGLATPGPCPYGSMAADHGII
jgi:hypothetical protein